jgi:hypothetical protein
MNVDQIEKACDAIDKVLEEQKTIKTIKDSRVKTFLISFESGHYKKIKGEWKGDSVWAHWFKSNGKMIHVNKDKVEYMEEI